MTVALPIDTQPLIVELLTTRGLLDSKKLEVLHETVNKEGIPVEEVLIKKGLASELDVARAYSEHLAIPLYDLQLDVQIDRGLHRLLPEKMCRDQLLAPIALDSQLHVAFVSPDQMLLTEELQLLTGHTIRPWIATQSTVDGVLQYLYSSESVGNALVGVERFEHMSEEEVEEEEDAMRDDEILHLDQPPPPGQDGRVIRQVNYILEQALRQGASDIHLEPFENECKIRLRIDGVLHELPPPTRGQFIPIVSRFKILAKMDIAERRVPQDGAIALRSGDKRLDLRVNTVPTVYGEKVVMRILDKGAVQHELTSLGFDERQSRDLVESIEAPHGLMLVTGPTGSGKSTTLYACLNLLNSPETNICTVEDPVEYKITGLNQVQVKTQVGLTFASALRAFLRQDPDVIMVGEVRDGETAQICLRAALTGHFVLSTIHTNDALSAVSRLQDMDIEPFLLAATLRVLEAQRLVRRLCKDCKEAYPCTEELAALHKFNIEDQLFRPKGCNSCRGSGYRGRVGIFEVVRITPVVAELIQNRTPLVELRQAAQQQGMKLLGDSALDKVRVGMTSLEEALSVSMTGQE